jgi:hypothetical protein
MSEPRKPEPDEELLEFLGGIDEVNDDSKDGDFSGFLANTDVDKAAEKPRSPLNQSPASTAPVKEGKSE